MYWTNTVQSIWTCEGSFLNCKHVLNLIVDACTVFYSPCIKFNFQSMTYVFHTDCTTAKHSTKSIIFIHQYTTVIQSILLSTCQLQCIEQFWCKLQSHHEFLPISASCLITTAKYKRSRVIWNFASGVSILHSGRICRKYLVLFKDKINR